MNIKAFDRDLSLAELLAHLARDKLQNALAALLVGPYRLLAEDRQVLLGAGNLAGECRQAAICLGFDCLGYLEVAPAAVATLPAVVMVIEMLLQSAQRYAMAADLHLQAVHEDYKALAQQHEAVKQSEARYRQLSAELEDRVKVQVNTIETARRQLYQAEKQASVGQLAAGVAHEINNPIGFIRSNLNTARNYVRKLQPLLALADAGGRPLAIAEREEWQFLFEDFEALLKESMDGIDRVAKIVADLKDFASIDHAEAREVDLNDSIRTVCDIAARDFRGRAQLALTLGELPPFFCVPGHINQALLNVLHNAGQSIQAQGQIQVRSSSSDGWIRIEIADNGSGIAATDLPRIFEPFFTTREVNQGRGLGLTVSQDIVQAHDGRIDVTSTAGAGSTFTFCLPEKRAARAGETVKENP
jgi:two-component system, NtrC family, sensor kinase